MTTDPVMHALVDLCEHLSSVPMDGPLAVAYGRALKVIREHTGIRQSGPMDECQRVLSLILERLDNEEWVPSEYKDMARECIKGSPYATVESK